MSLPRYATPLHLEPRPSRQLAMMTLVLHGGAVVLMVLMPLPGWSASLGVIFLIGSLVTVMRGQILLRAPRSVVRLVWGQDGEWTLITRGGVTLPAYLRAGSYVHPRLVVLNFHCHEAKCSKSVVLLGDSLPGDSLRRLRVRLRSLPARGFHRGVFDPLGDREA